MDAHYPPPMLHDQQVRGVTVRLSETAFWGFRTFAHWSEIPTSAFIEAAGRVWGDTARDLAPIVPEMLELARTVDFDRRSPERTPSPRTLNVRLTEIARTGFAEFCRRHGVTLAGLLEALGLTMERIGPEGVPKEFPFVTAMAREVVVARRKRKD